MILKNRQEAGKKLISKLEKYRGDSETVILGLPRGGVVVAFEISQGLGLPLDIVVPRKIGAPNNPEFAIGAITEDGKGVFNSEAIDSYDISREYIDKEIKKERKEILRRLKTYRGKRESLDLHDKITILADDGAATGATMRAAIKFSRNKGAKKVIAAVPVIARDTLEIIRKEADEVIYLEAPLLFGAVGAFYEDFEQVEDEEVIRLIRKS